MPAPLKNANRMRHGLRASKLPSGCQYVEKAIISFRIAIEDAVLILHGEISVLHAAYVQSACRSEQRAMLLERWLREADAKGQLSIQEQIRLLRERDSASARRDACLRQLLTPSPVDDQQPGRRTIDVLRELNPEQLAEFKSKAAIAMEHNRQAIDGLLAAERSNRALLGLANGDSIPPILPETVPEVFCVNGSTNGSGISHAGSNGEHSGQQADQQAADVAQMDEVDQW